MQTYFDRVDLPYYREHIAEFLPDQVVDFHTHVYRAQYMGQPLKPPRDWAEYVSPRTWPLTTLRRYYQRLFPGKRFTPVVFGMPRSDADADAMNRFVAESAASDGDAFPFLVTRPQWSAEELEVRLRSGPFKGLKPYLSLAPNWTGGDVSIFDFLPREHLDVAQDLGLCVLLHIPRAGRLTDRDNVRELHQIVADFPRLKVVVAHIGRAYCLPNARRGLPQLRDCPSLLYDFSASANADVFELALREVGPGRLIFGTDLPAVAFRARRLCEDDHYVNIVRRASFSDSHLRVAPPEERDSITFYVYEQMAAFREAAERVGLSRGELEDVFRNNALSLLA